MTNRRTVALAALLGCAGAFGLAISHPIEVTAGEVEAQAP
jgi:hypothetical protein